jgi:hypothetical protein
MEDDFKQCLVRLPFPSWKSIPTVIGWFLDYHLVRFFRNTGRGVRLSDRRSCCRSEPRNFEFTEFIDDHCQLNPTLFEHVQHLKG